jgi:transcriptional regulator GlxA family with amidase domain
LPLLRTLKTREYPAPETTLTVGLPSEEASQNISGHAMDHRIQRAVLDIQKSILITTKQMADSASLSVDYFSRLFKKETSVSPQHYLKNVRLRAACVFLESSELSVKELSTRAGFKDQSHFVRDFQKAYGVSPMRHRIQWRKNQLGQQ